MCVHVCAQLCLTLCDPMDCSMPGSSVHGIFQESILEWVAISSSTGSFQPRGRFRVSCIGRRFLYTAPPGKTCNYLAHGKKCFMKDFLIPEEQIYYNAFLLLTWQSVQNWFLFFFFKKVYFSDSFIESSLGWFSVQFSGYFGIMHKLPISNGTMAIV